MILFLTCAFTEDNIYLQVVFIIVYERKLKFGAMTGRRELVKQFFIIFNFRLICIHINAADLDQLSTPVGTRDCCWLLFTTLMIAIS